MRTLLVDNHDSYTFNLFHLIAEVNGVEPVVLPNDSAELTTRYLDEFDNVVLSPGAGRPQVARDLGRVAELLLATTIPLLGVCLGHQAIGHAAGAIVEDAPQPRHGHLSSIKHDGDDLFAGLPNGFVAVRYHSLCVREPLPDVLAATAWAEDGVVMGLRHRLLPRWGVQFHPESVASQHGHQLMANFRRLSARARTRPAVSLRAPAAPGDTAQHRPSGTWTAPPEPPAFVLTHTVLTGAADTEAVFTEFFATASPSFWLDSSRAEPGLARFSFLGDASGPLGEVLTYRVGDGQVRVRDRAGQHVERGTVLDVLEQRLRARRIAAPGLPFDFTCGYVGYFGYEMRADCGAEATQVAETPDAVWIFADQLIAVDHEHDLTYVLAVHRRGGDADSAAAWVSATARRVRALAARRRAGERDDPATTKRVTWTAPAGLATNRAGYEADIETCRRQLMLGESYEICLTTKVRVPADDEDLAFYRRLRRANPAPYAALLRLDGLTVHCSSPERFLRVGGDGTVEAKPIKGTAPRDTDPVRDARLAAELATNAKTRAENLMIVDLLRNDLGRVCANGSVHVPSYLAVESYPTVHQLVSTVRGRLRTGLTAVDCVRACFPGGSMTGAPKRRTMEIIDRLEGEARGVYSGSLGYFGLSGGADLNIVIRTAVRVGDQLTVGAGGAIVLGSVAPAEFDEMLLKASTPLRAWIGRS